MKKVVVSVNINDDKNKRNAMKTVSTVKGISSIEVSLAEGTITVIGDADPVLIMSKLDKKWKPKLESVGPPDDEIPYDQLHWMQPRGYSYNYSYEEKPKPRGYIQHYHYGYNNDYNYGYNNDYNYGYNHSYEENPNACVIC